MPHKAPYTSDSARIVLEPGEPLEAALRRLKKAVERAGTLRAIRDRRSYRKPSQKRRDKRTQAARRRRDE
jgi:small subunit ribosomal protein S21